MIDQAELISRQEVLNIIATALVGSLSIAIGGIVALIKKIGKIDKLEADINMLWAAHRARLEIQKGEFK